MQIPTLTTKRLVLRPVTHSDAHDALTVLGGADMRRFSGLPVIRTPQEAWDFVNGMIAYNTKGHGFALSIHTPTCLVGFIRLMRVNRETSSATLSFEIGQPYWGQGYASEAVAALVDYARTTLELATLHANVDRENHASRRVLAKSGIQ